MVLSSSAQGAIEYLLIIGAAIIVVAVVIVAITSVSFSSKNQLASAGASHTIDPLKETSGIYFRIRNYYYRKSGLGNGLVGLWHFDEGGGTITNDSSGNGNNGTLSSNLAWAGGKFGGALFPNGLYSVSCGDSSSLNFSSNKITIGAWVYLNTLAPQYSVIAAQRSGCGDFSWQFYGDVSDKLYFGIKGTDNLLLECSSDNSPALNQWEYVVASYDGAQIVLYKNGVPIKTCPGSKIMKSVSGGIKIGDESCNHPYAGSIDEVAIWNRALSASEIQSLYTNSQ
ncbi:Concanavalin A-like lectin/glucanases superfamily protein [uncultured archaeon]|nr:Concanavalin A-like lectin/glucanases superfamily protein [uncultured archaeon]